MRGRRTSAGTCRPLASSPIGGLLDMIHNVGEKAPRHRTVTQDEVGGTAAFLASPLSSGIIAILDVGSTTMDILAH